MDQDAVRDILREAKSLAARYYALTGKPLGVTGEVAELEAAERIGLDLAIARTAFYDATRVVDGRLEKIQIKGRAVDPGDRYRGRAPAIKCDGDFESVMLVLLDRATFDALEIWEASREAVGLRLSAPGSKSRNERGSLGISQFKSIAKRIWPPPQVPDPRLRGRLVSDSISSAPPARQPTGIGAMIANLLMDPSLEYAQIVFRVKQHFPEARTSTKSVASTARDLRRNGVTVPVR